MILEAVTGETPVLRGRAIAVTNKLGGDRLIVRVAIAQLHRLGSLSIPRIITDLMLVGSLLFPEKF